MLVSNFFTTLGSLSPKNYYTIVAIPYRKGANTISCITQKGQTTLSELVESITKKDSFKWIKEEVNHLSIEEKRHYNFKCGKALDQLVERIRVKKRPYLIFLAQLIHSKVILWVFDKIGIDPGKIVSRNPIEELDQSIFELRKLKIYVSQLLHEEGV